MEPFRLLELPPELLGDLLLYVSSAGIVRLWTTGDRRVRFVLSLPRVVRKLCMSKVRSEDDDEAPKCELFLRFPHLYDLRISYTDEGFTTDLSDVLIDSPSLPRSLKALYLHMGNAEEIFVKPGDRKGNPLLADSYINIAEALPNLTSLELIGRSHLNGAWLTQVSLPPNLTRLRLPNNDLITESDLFSLPHQIVDLGLGDFNPLKGESGPSNDIQEEPLLSPSDDSKSTSQRMIPHSLEHLTFSSRQSFHGTGKNFFGLLPPCLKQLTITYATHLGNEEVQCLPTTLTILECSKLSNDAVPLLSRLVNLRCLNFLGDLCERDITKLLPRKLERLTIRKYRYVDDDFFFGLPKTLVFVNVVSFHSPMNNRRNGLTRACIPHIPPLLTSLDLSKMDKIEPSDFALLPKKLTRLTVPNISADHLANIPGTITALIANSGTINEDFVKNLPPRIRRLNMSSLQIAEPESLARLPASLDEIRFMTSRTPRGRYEKIFVFENEWARFLPSTLSRISIRCPNRIGDDLVAHLSNNHVVHLELHGPEVRFSQRVISLLPRTVEWLELDGVEGWTLSEEELALLPTKLHWMYISFVDESSVPLLSAEELKLRLPKSLGNGNHNLPTSESDNRPSTFGF